jgi:hypothetical protein
MNTNNPIKHTNQLSIIKPTIQQYKLPPKPPQIPIVAPTPIEHEQFIENELSSTSIFPHEIQEIKDTQVS